MTPETRAARDRLARFAGPEFQPPPLDLPTELNCLTIAEVKQLVAGAEEAVREAIIPDLLAVLAALDQHETHLEAVRQDIRQVAAEAGFVPRTEPVEIIHPIPDGTDAEEEPHRLTVRLIPHRDINGVDQGLKPYRELHHAAACDRLKYGQRCPFDDFEGPGGVDDWPVEPGEYLGHYWASKYWTDLGWEYDAGIHWEDVEPEEPKP